MLNIPYDPSLVLGQIVEKEKFEQLLALAQCQKPASLAFTKMNNLIKMNLKLKMIKSEMDNMGVGFDKLLSLLKKLSEMKELVADATIDYAEKAIAADENARLLTEKFDQNTISSSIESPIDYEMSAVEQFPLSFDSLEFDVQYIRNEENTDDTSSHAMNVAASASVGASGTDPRTMTKYSVDATTSSSVHANTLSQTSNHKIEGTIVISAFATHKNATIIEPLKLDPEKAITAWNITYPDDPISVDSRGIFQAVFQQQDGKDTKGINIITGFGKASSFVGLVHILQEEQSSSFQMSLSASTSVKAEVGVEQISASVTGSFGASASIASNNKSLNSSSRVENHANLVCSGVIPNIAASSIKTTVANMKVDPSEMMNQLAAMQGASDSAVNHGMQTGVSGAQGSESFLEMNSDYIRNTVSALGAFENENNKVIDTNSMMNAFTDFVTQVQTGDAGVPISFYLKKLTKQDIAKCYVRRFYPNGATDPKAAQRGMLGQEAKEE